MRAYLAEWFHEDEQEHDREAYARKRDARAKLREITEGESDHDFIGMPTLYTLEIPCTPEAMLDALSGAYRRYVVAEEEAIFEEQEEEPSEEE